MYAENLVTMPYMTLSCLNCRLNKLCLVKNLDDRDRNRLNTLMKHPRPLKRGQHLYRQGDKLTSLYVVMAGSVKNYFTSLEGHEQVTGFYLPGEILGLDALAEERYASSAAVLERTVLCELPYKQFHELAQSMPRLFMYILRSTSRELVHDNERLLIMGQHGAGQRLATFLLNLSKRYQSRGFSELSFNLSMSRYDIGSYLGLTNETVSRLLHRFQHYGLLKVERSLVHLSDITGLQYLALHGETSRPEFALAS